MKRKLIQRNKQFLSGRYESYAGNGSFQKMYYYVYKKSIKDYVEKVTWMWFYSEEYLTNNYQEV